jgi:REP element-mobilizing transposase RayT
MNRYEQYVRSEFDKLKNTKYGFSVKIFDGEGNHTHCMELTPNRAKDILKILNERKL